MKHIEEWALRYSGARRTGTQLNKETELSTVTG